MTARKMNGYGKGGGAGGAKPHHAVSCGEIVMLAERETKYPNNIPVEK